MFKNKSGMRTSQNTKNSKHECVICLKRRSGCIEYPKQNRNGKLSWICFHCREDKMKKEVFNGTVERECDYCGRAKKCKVTRDGKKICEYCEEHNISAIQKIKELEIFG